MNDDGRLEALDDAALLRRARHDATAFRALYDRHAPRLHGFLWRRTRDGDAALELTAETFARAWLSREQFVDRGEGAAPWLFGIARHALADSVRQRSMDRRASRQIGLDVAGEVPAPREDWLVGFDEDLAAAIADLPEAQRRAVEMRLLDGDSYDDLARDLRISPGAARVRVHRGIARLRGVLGARPEPGAATTRGVAAPVRVTTTEGDVP